MTGFIVNDKVKITISFAAVIHGVHIFLHYYQQIQWRGSMDVIIDFNSEEAIYVQLCNQIIVGIATNKFHDGDSLPSVRQMAENVGINMHTVNKAYSILKREGFLQLDRRRGAIIKVDADKLNVLNNMKKEFGVVVARGICNGVTKNEAHELIDELYTEFSPETMEEM